MAGFWLAPGLEFTPAKAGAGGSATNLLFAEKYFAGKMGQRWIELENKWK